MCGSSDNEKKIHDMFHHITLELIRRGLSVTTMESCTSGLIASLLTDTEGASAIMKGAFITYSNEAKIRQGVPADVIRDHGVYSIETAEAMADACRRAYSADIGIGITGSFGNVDPANKDSVPGVIFLAVRFNGNTASRRIILEPQPSRYAYKLAAASYAGELLISLLFPVQSFTS